MKVIKFVLAAAITLAVTISFNLKIDNIPPLGKFFNPLGGFWANSEKEAISGPASLRFKGLNDEVVVQFDEYMIPHIFAQNDNDLVFAQGYITAFHRLWQMEFQLYSTAGRISEILGERAIEYDKRKRRHGMTYGARRTLEKWKDDDVMFSLIKSYTAGVNAYINSLEYSNYPIEFKLLDYKPEPWSEYKCSLLLKEMADQLSRGEADLENTNVLKLFGRENFDFLFPETPPNDDLDPVIPRGTTFDFVAEPIPPPDSLYPLAIVTETLEKPDPANGSNNFAVGPQKTGDGTLLANEPDLGLNLPSIWYVAHLNAPGINVFGATLPGLPGVIIGHNDSIAWGMTNAKRDLVDWFKIEFRNSERDEYKYDNRWLKTEKVIEEIKVRNGSTVYDTIIFTHYGPVVYDRNFKGNEEAVDLAMRWTAHDPSEDIKALYLVNKADNYDEFESALEYFVGPPQNFAFASASGDIGLIIPGKYPIKWREQGKFILDGTNSAHDWLSYMPDEHELRVKNPSRGFISSANQHPVDSTYPYYTYDYHFEHYRGRRINDRLNILNYVTTEEMMKLQHDNFNYRAFESLPMMLDSLDTTRFNTRKIEIYRLMKSWDFFNHVQSRSASFYEIWWHKLYGLVWDEFENQEASVIKPHVYSTIRILKNSPGNEFMDIAATPEIEVAQDLFQQSFEMAVDSLDNWMQSFGDDYTWANFKNTTVLHLLRIAEFSVDHISIGGNENIVNAASGRHGPSWRMVVKLNGEGVTSWGVYPGSQTGNPGNPKYAHMIEDWASGNYYEMLFPSSPLSESEQIIFEQNFLPIE